eukprot:1759818-Prymnesium_polylepis.2
MPSPCLTVTSARSPTSPPFAGNAANSPTLSCTAIGAEEDALIDAEMMAKLSPDRTARRESRCHTLRRRGT